MIVTLSSHSPDHSHNKIKLKITIVSLAALLSSVSESGAHVIVCAILIKSYNTYIGRAAKKGPFSRTILLRPRRPPPPLCRAL